MIYSTNLDQLLTKVNIMIRDPELSKYKEGLLRWLTWQSENNVVIPEIDPPYFYRAFVSGDEIVGIQIWENEYDSEFNVWISNFIMSGYHEDNSEITIFKSK